MAGILSDSSSGLLGTLFSEGSATGLTDEQLLEQFVSQRDASAEHAFGVLVQRHGPMVLRVCRSALRNLHDAEDVFQATFLVLARKASSLRTPGLLGPWLHGVARRSAQKERARRFRLERLIQGAGSMTGIEAASATGAGTNLDEEAEMLHEEIDRLPERYRTPVVLCDLEGLTHDEAARRLGCPTGTLGVRLMRARARLRARLIRRGMTPAGRATLPLVPRCEPLAASLAVQTARAATSFACGRAAPYGAISSQVTAIAVGVLRAMSIKKMAIGMSAILACGLIATGAAALAFQTPPKRPNAPQPAQSAKKASAVEDDAKSILANGGFERGDSGGRSPASWEKGAAVAGVSYLWDPTVAHGGRASLRLRKTAQRYFPIAQWYQSVKRDGNAKCLKVSAFVKAKNLTKAILDVQFEGRDGQWTHGWAAYIGPKQDGAAPFTHDWKKYEGVVAIPDGTDKLIIAAQIYGPGDVWFDDVVAEYTDAEPTDPTASRPRGASTKGADTDLADVADVPCEERKAGEDPRKRYFLIGPMAGSGAPAAGYRVLILLPGGDGSAGFQPFARRIAKNGVPSGYLVAQLVAVSWSPEQFEQVVWRTATDGLPRVEFTTEEFVNAVIADIERTRKIDPRYVFTLGWSSGGPPVYATSFWPGTRLTGSFVAMSVFKAERYPTLENARGHGYYILHSQEDAVISIRMAEEARDELRRIGAKVELRTYTGGHGWHGDVYGEIRRGVDWLEANHSAPAGG
jgi:RNA polymerase sigma factor (sigma-70 family)